MVRARAWVLGVLLVAGCQWETPEPRFDRTAYQPVAQKTQSPARRAADTQAKPPPRRPPPERPRAKGPASPDPEGGEFTLAEATEGLSGKGPLKATITTNLGALECTLFDDKAPNTVANFVGLARGKRPFWHAAKGEWVKQAYYDGTSFHRVIPGFMIQGGDYTGTGAGDVGYTIDDELHESLKHDRAGLLCMANKGPNTNGAQFFITDAAAPHLTRMGSYTIFGECGPTELISKIANAPKRGERPIPPVVMTSVTVRRGG